MSRDENEKERMNLFVERCAFDFTHVDAKLPWKNVDNAMELLGDLMFDDRNL